MDDRTLEKEIERKLVRIVKKHGGRCEKLVNVGAIGFPSHTVLLPDGKIAFVETKRPEDCRYSAMQDKWHDQLRDLDFLYFRIKDLEDLDFFERLVCGTLLTCGQECNNCKHNTESYLTRPCDVCETANGVPTLWESME